MNAQTIQMVQIGIMVVIAILLFVYFWRTWDATLGQLKAHFFTKHALVISALWFLLVYGGKTLVFDKAPSNPPAAMTNKK